MIFNALRGKSGIMKVSGTQEENMMLQEEIALITKSVRFGSLKFNVTSQPQF